MRHRSHAVEGISRNVGARERVRTGALLDDVRAGEGRAERLYQFAEEILTDALRDKDRSGALQAIRVAVSVMSEARSYMELRGEITLELGREKSPLPVSIQIMMPGMSPDAIPRVAFVSDDAVVIDAEYEEICLPPHP